VTGARSVGNVRQIPPVWGQGKSPEFKVQLFAHRYREALTVTRRNPDRTRVTECKDQKDELLFRKGADGRTRVQLSRDGKAVMQLA